MTSRLVCCCLLGLVAPVLAWLPQPTILTHAVAQKPVRLCHNGHGPEPVQLSRRQVTASLASVLGLLVTSPGLGRAVEEDFIEAGEPTLLRYLYLIMRVQEATEQEERLIKSGKFKDLQRANVKMAATMMLNNYRLEDSVVQASKSAASNKVYEASMVGREAVEALTQINEYFDASENSLQVNYLSPDKQKFVLSALSAARTSLDKFMGLMPKDEVATAAAILQKENEDNKREFEAANADGGGGYLNPGPAAVAPAATSATATSA